ncbi:hypothetical protein R3P38DRAFT_2800125 [Favolaschia claudopus]|uniref:Uncharacterized protein n=1 Tax=Favolaschia claudopus TaxID=2862362 RepID=A0AAV9ZY89_9AGAR
MIGSGPDRVYRLCRHKAGRAASFTTPPSGAPGRFDKGLARLGTLKLAISGPPRPSANQNWTSSTPLSQHIRATQDQTEARRSGDAHHGTMSWPSCATRSMTGEQARGWLRLKSQRAGKTGAKKDFTYSGLTAIGLMSSFTTVAGLLGMPV